MKANRKRLSRIAQLCDQLPELVDMTNQGLYPFEGATESEVHDATRPAGDVVALLGHFILNTLGKYRLVANKPDEATS